MALVECIGTYLPAWGSEHSRAAGPDEDALTLAVEAGLAALPGHTDVQRVVLVSRDLPLLEGGNGAALLAGLGLEAATLVEEHLGGAPAVLDAVLSAPEGSLVIGVDLEPAGAAAAFVGGHGLDVRAVTRLARSLPERARGQDGRLHHYDDPRLVRDRGLNAALARVADLGEPIAIAGVSHAQASAVCGAGQPHLPTTGASSALFALAAVSEAATTGILHAVEQATLTGAQVLAGSAPVHRREPPAQAVPQQALTKGIDIPISLPAYDRAFEAKLRFEAASCGSCGSLSLPARFRCLDCGSESARSSVRLPRLGSVYTTTTIRVPVPGVPTPYSLAIIELDDVGVRVLSRVTGVPAGSVSIGDRGRLVLRRAAVRSGVPDYAYAFAPEETAA